MGVLTPARRKYGIIALICAVVLGMSSIALMRADGATTFSTVQPGNFTGSAFDACTAPPSASMKAWKKESPYRAIGIYIGGVNRGCAQPQLTADWVKEQVQAGWKLIPLYVGLQASCTTVTAKRNLIDNTQAAAQGRAAAADAVTQAGKLGLAKQSVIIYDMEAYRTDDATCRAGVLAFMNGWTAGLHDNSYFSGYYSSVTSGIADQVASYSAAGYARPDYVDFARWDQTITVADPLIPATAWPGKRRMKQYRGGHKETFGGVTINIDNDYVDFALPPSARSADYTGNGWPDVLARSSSGALSVFPGNGGFVDNAARRSVNGSWSGLSGIVRIGDLNRDGREDIVARQLNDLYFYPGTATGVGPRKKIAAGMFAMKELTAIGDLTGDGYPDLLAVSPGKNLYLYAGRPGAKLAAPKLVGNGWGNKSELAGAGDFNRDGVPDLAARLNDDGGLYLWTGRKGGFTGTRLRLATSVTDLRDLVGIGDFDRDGYPDLMAVNKSNGGLMLLRGAGTTVRAGVRVASGYGGMSPIL